jgi:type I restriction enzyme M protein
MNLAVHGLSGDIREGNSYYDDIHDSVGRFDFAMANPPFNVDKVDKDRLKTDRRFPFGLPRYSSAIASTTASSSIRVEWPRPVPVRPLTSS